MNMKKLLIAFGLAVGLFGLANEAKADQFFTTSSTGVFVGTGSFTVTKVCMSTGAPDNYLVLIASYPGRSSAFLGLASYDESDWIAPAIKFSSVAASGMLYNERCVQLDADIDFLDSGAVSAGPSAGQDGLMVFMAQTTIDPSHKVTVYTRPKSNENQRRSR